MPFTPITMPGLGVSTLKAALRREGFDCDIYYGALDFFDFFFSHSTPIADYDYISLNSDVGDVFFAHVLWRDMPDTWERVQEVLAALRDSPNPIMGRDQLLPMMERIESYAARAEAFVEACYRARDWSRYDIVGFSSTFSQHVAALCLARTIRERHPQIHIVFGGANCEGEMGKQLLRSFAWVDTVIQGEADFALPQFVRRFAEGQDLSDVPGIVYRDGPEVRAGAAPQPVQELDAVPIPDFHDYFEQLPELFRGGRLRLSVPIETSRGCWWGAVSHCTFCGLNPTTMSFRAKSPARALAEYEELSSVYGVTDFCAVDNIISRDYFRSVLPALEGRGWDIFYETKANLSEQDVAQLARAGVGQIQPGIESLSTEILRLMKKGVKGIQNVALLKWCAQHGVEPIWFMLYRFPHESHAPYLRDIALIPRLYHLPPPKNPNPVLIDRYSPLFMGREEIGLTNVRPTGRVGVSYRGLNERERFDISYHFDAELPQGRELPYEVPLWEAVLGWNYQQARGAQFLQFRTTATTVLVDTRREGSRRIYVLTGTAHLVHSFMRQAAFPRSIAAHLRETPLPEPGLDDLLLANVAGMLDAHSIAGPTDEADLPRFLAELDDAWIVLEMDGRWMSLSIDGVDPAQVEALGLTPFVRSAAELVPRKGSVDEPSPPTERPLVQLSRA